MSEFLQILYNNFDDDPDELVKIALFHDQPKILQFLENEKAKIKSADPFFTLEANILVQQNSYERLKHWFLFGFNPYDKDLFDNAPVSVMKSLNRSDLLNLTKANDSSMEAINNTEEVG